MNKCLVSLLGLLLFAAYPGHLKAQETVNSQPLKSVKNPAQVGSSPPLTPAAPTPDGAAQELYDQGMKLVEKEQFPEAADYFRRATELDPEFADAYAALGRAYFKMRQWQKSIDNLRRSATLNAKQREAQDAIHQKLVLSRTDNSTNSTEETNSQTSLSANVADATVGTPRNLTTTKTDQQKQGTPQPRLTNDIDLKGSRAELNKPELTPRDITAPNSTDSNSLKSPPAVGTRVSLEPTRAAEAKKSTSSANPPSALANEMALTKIYRVGPNDVLDIRSNDSQPQQSTLFTVTPSGLLAYPMLPDPIAVNGLTVDEIAARIEREFNERALLSNPKVSVGVRDYASHTILVSGLVKDSGTKFLRREAIPLYVVVADAQPLPEAARATVVRGEQNQTFDVDLTQTSEMNLLIHSGDVISLQPSVPEFIYIGGEVKLPGEKAFRRGLTLTQAIIAAGGTVSKSKAAEIGRDNGQGFLVATRFNLKDIHSGKAIDPLLKPGDRIMILH